MKNIKWLVFSIAALAVAGSLLYINDYNDKTSHYTEVLDEGIVMPLPDHSAELAISEDFDWSQAAIEANIEKAFQLVTLNQNCILKQTIEPEEKPVKVTLEVKEKGMDLYLYASFNGALSKSEILAPGSSQWEPLPYLWATEPYVIPTPELGKWQFRFTPYPPGQSVENIKGLFYALQIAHSDPIKLPRATNKTVLKLPNTLESAWTYEVTVLSLETDETVTYTSQKLEIPLFEGNNRVLIGKTDGLTRSKLTLYHVLRDTVPPELKVIFPKEYKAGETYVEDQKDFGIGIECNELVEAYIQNKRVLTESGDTATYFGANLTLKKGLNTITIEATDASGNLTTMTIKVLYK